MYEPRSLIAQDLLHSSQRLRIRRKGTMESVQADISQGMLRRSMCQQLAFLLYPHIGLTACVLLLCRSSISGQQSATSSTSAHS